MASDPSILQQLEIARRDLLELTTSNRLLSTDRDQERGASVEIKDESSTEIFRMLVTEKLTMQFEQGIVEGEGEAGPKKRRTTKAKPLAAAATTEPVDKTKDSILHTELEPAELDSRLSSLVTDATTSEQEKGVNVLYLALGFLRWYESDKPDKPRDAPLLLIPVKLERNKAGVRYSLTYKEGGEIETNLTLQVRMKVDFGISIPDVPETEDLSPATYFHEVQRAIASQPNWEVLPDDVMLWFFSFTKLLMYRDLDPSSWPAHMPLAERPLISALLHTGFPPVQPLCEENARIDSLFDPAQTTHVIDCDSSQSLVIEEACRGRSLVIQGPPGTGKSQTITNLIASAVHSGKTILFVAEKMAALEVVKRRLDNIGLGDMCLELHSKMASKSAVVKEVERTLKLGRPLQPSELNETVTRLKAVRDQLNAHVDLMHLRCEPFGKSPYEVLTDLIELRAANTPLPDFQLPQAIEWTPAQFGERLTAVNELAEVSRELKNPAEHPWRGANLDQILPLDLERLLVATPQQIATLDQLVASLRNLAQRLGDEPALNLNEVARTLRTVDCLLAAPDLDPQPMNGLMWRDHRQAVKEIADGGRAILAAREALQDKVTDAAWDADVSAAKQAYATYGQSFFRMFRSSYRAARRQLKSLLVGRQPETFEQRLEILNLLHASNKAKKEIAEAESVGQKSFGRYWLGLKTDWKRVDAWETWDANTAASDVSPRFRELLVLLEKPDDIKQLADHVRVHLTTFLDGFTVLCQSLKIDFDAAFGDGKKANAVPSKEDKPAPANSIDKTLAPLGAMRSALLSDVRTRLIAWQENPEGLQHWQKYRRARQTVAEIGEGALLSRILSGQIPAEQASAVFRFACAEAMLRQTLKLHPELDTFSGGKYEQLIQEFSNLDIRRLELARIEIAASHWDAIGSKKHGDLTAAVSILKHEMQKKRRHLPLRQLLSQAGPAIQAVKPVFMMSPLSVAQFLQSGVLTFDMLLIDEASQVRPVEALGAAARCRQMVVVGDDKQMPPTQFFGSVIGDVAWEDESNEMQAGDVESILGLCIARNMPQRMLRWHYRSKHESLIAVSNQQFYDNQLYVIPSSEKDGALGVKFHFIEQGKFLKGCNLVEAKVVAEAVMRHAKERPDWTLGVGAFSVTQRDAIIKELEELRKANPQSESFFDPNAPDPFFIKNLENIQGDERDAIFVSVGYGPGEDGKVSLNFGPVSTTGGERRLNVLMTRAKRTCEIFSSMRAEDIDLGRATGKGPAAFRAYLKFAQTGGQVESKSNATVSDRLVAIVKQQLEGRGFQVQTGVGIAGVFVDLAILDPEHPERYLLGIDVDGESYRAGRSARDRDRTRQGVLEGQGWNMYRLWSLEWFRRPNEELNRLMEAIEKARRGNYPRTGPRLASSVSEVPRKPEALDPLTASVGEIQPVPERPVREPAAGSSTSDMLAGLVKVGAKVGAAVLTAEKGKGLDAAIRAINEEGKKKK